MLKLSPCGLCFAVLTAWAAMAFGQTPAVLALHVKTPDGLAVQNADVAVQSAQPQEAARVWIPGRQTNNSGLPVRFFVE
jgi:hypothetical protein